MNYNKVLIGGRLVRDPEARFTVNGNSLCECRVASSRKYKEKEEKVFVDVTFWGKTAETVAKYFKKGDPIFVEGRLKLDEWEDRTTGAHRQKLSITGEMFQFIGSRASAPASDNRDGDREAPF